MILKKKIIISIGGLVILTVFGFAVFQSTYGGTQSASHVEEGFDEEPETEDQEWYLHPRLKGLADWKRPEGPLRVALQAGHWKAAEAPDEQENLRTKTGTSGGGKTEWQVNLEIAQATKKLLESAGIIVEILPTTIPPNYWADVFVAIHADGNLNTAVSGFKSAAPRRDYTGKAQQLAQLLDKEYGLATKLNLDPNVTRNMRGYYAFNWRRYEHSLHPRTVAAIIETGFLTNAGDRKIIVSNQQKSAQGIASAILKFLEVN